MGTRCSACLCLLLSLCYRAFGDVYSIGSMTSEELLTYVDPENCEVMYKKAGSVEDCALWCMSTERCVVYNFPSGNGPGHCYYYRIQAQVHRPQPNTDTDFSRERMTPVIQSNKEGDCQPTNDTSTGLIRVDDALYLPSAKRYYVFSQTLVFIMTDLDLANSVFCVVQTALLPSVLRFIKSVKVAFKFLSWDERNYIIAAVAHNGQVNQYNGGYSRAPRIPIGIMSEPHYAFLRAPQSSLENINENITTGALANHTFGAKGMLAKSQSFETVPCEQLNATVPETIPANTTATCAVRVSNDNITETYYVLISDLYQFIMFPLPSVYDNQPSNDTTLVLLSDEKTFGSLCGSVDCVNDTRSAFGRKLPVYGHFIIQNVG